MTDLKAELDALNEHIKALEAQRADIYKRSLELPDDQKVCQDWIAESLSEVPNEMKFPITVHGIAWEGDLWEKGANVLSRIKPGDLASVRPADVKAGTYLGVCLGAQCIHDSASFDPAAGILRFRKFGGNPTFWIPALKRVVYGAGSWWSKIDSPEKLQAISDTDIAAVPYVQMMKAMLAAPVPSASEPKGILQEPPTPEQLERMRTRRDRMIELHTAFGHPVLTEPTVPPDDRVRLRVRFVVEEALELVQACFKYCNQGDSRFVAAEADLLEIVGHYPLEVNLPLAADALEDIQVVCEGANLEFGVDSGPVQLEVHRTNMAKANGPVRADGKREKPPGWTPPDIAGVLAKQRRSA